jgi:hypothetical protein
LSALSVEVSANCRSRSTEVLYKESFGAQNASGGR